MIIGHGDAPRGPARVEMLLPRSCCPGSSCWPPWVLRPSMERVPFPLLGGHENHRAASAPEWAARGGDPDPRGLSLQLE